MFAGQRAIKTSPWWNQREVTWQQFKPAMLQHKDVWDEILMKSAQTPATLENVAVWKDIASKCAKHHTLMLPGYQRQATMQISLSAKELLKATDTWEVETPDLGVTTVDLMCSFVKDCMSIEPNEPRFPAAFARIQRLLSKLGSAAVIKDVLEKTTALTLCLTGPRELQFLGQVLALGGSSIDLHPHADVLKTMFDSVLIQVANGELDNCKPDHVRETLEHLETIVGNAGLTKYKQTLQCQHLVTMAIFSRSEFKALGANCADIAAVDKAEETFGKLYRSVQIAEKEHMELRASEAGLVDEHCRMDQVAECRKVLQEFSAVSIENKERALNNMRDQVCDKCFLDNISGKPTWTEGVKDFTEFAEKSKTTIGMPEKLQGLKQMIADMKGVILNNK